MSAVHKKKTSPELHFFNNCFEDQFSTRERIIRIYRNQAMYVLGKCPDRQRENNYDKQTPVFCVHLPKTQAIRKVYNQVVIKFICTTGAVIYTSQSYGYLSPLEEVWRVARYTTAAPMFFKECDDYVDGGVLANNPSETGLTAIQDYFHSRGLPFTTAIVVRLDFETFFCILTVIL